MSVQSEIDRIKKNVNDTLKAIGDTGVQVGTGSDALPAAARALANEKQNKLTGTAGQFVGFDDEGNAQAQDVSASGIPTSEKGQPNGVATLDQAGKVPEAQIPERLSRQKLLSAETAAVYGLGSDAVPNDVFMILGIGADKYGYGITVQYPDGTPAVGLSVSGVTDRMGQPIKTDSNGFFLAVSTEKKITFSVVSPYFDVANISAQVINSTGVLTRQIVGFAYKTYENYVLITSSKTFQFFKDRIVDFTAVGGGGAGGGSQTGYDSNTGITGGGGGGGYTNTLLNKIVSKTDRIKIAIGSGGRVPSLSPTNIGTHLSGNGSKTTISIGESIILEANGGMGGQIVITKTPNYTAQGGSGSGPGGSWVIREWGDYTANSGSPSTRYIFNEQNLGLAGGGGGGSSFSNSGGKPYGAAGANRNAGRPNAETPGIGGGGGATGGWPAGDFASHASAGGSGGVYLRWK